MRVVLATHNPNKVREFQRILTARVSGLEIVAYDGPEPVENGTSFAENALIKARVAAEHTGLPALADDSGLCVDVLGGAPGIFSARWAGRAASDQNNVELLLEQLRDVSTADRTAHFHCTIALVTDSEDIVVHGDWPGGVAVGRRGGEGFGYDPIFVPDGHSVTSAELSPDEKNAESHRARAFAELIPELRRLAPRAGDATDD